MKSTVVSIAEGKKGSVAWSRMPSRKGEIVVTKRGKPVAVILPYEEYQQSKRVEGYRKISKARETFLETGLSADEVFKESRGQLEKKR